MSFLRAMLSVLALSLFFVVVQGTLLPSVCSEQFVPALILVLVVFVSFYEPTPRGAILVFLSGLVFDLSSGILLGPWACGFIAVFSIFAGFSQRIFVESFVAGFLAVFIAVLIANPIYIALYYGAGISPVAALSSTFMQGLVTALVGPPLLRFLARLLCRREGASTSGMFQARTIKGASR